MKRFAVSLVGLVASLAVFIHDAAANDHSFSLPASFPAGPSIVSETTESLVVVNADLQAKHPAPKFKAKLDGIYMNGAPFKFKGASYFGMETDIMVPHGLWGGDESTTLQKVAEFMRANDFNSLRLPLAVDAVLQNLPVNKGVIGNEVALVNAFDGSTVPYLSVLDYVIKVFGENNILILLDAHWLNHLDNGIGELWYTNDTNKNDFRDAWKILAIRYKDTWNVVGADLKNEPHGIASWGDRNESTDFRLAALKWATTILKIVPRWLIFVEGQSQSSRDVPEFPTFWGENLMDVQRAPLVLPVAERLVYSPHVYGPDVYNQPYFMNASFPENMPAIWDVHFGFIQNTYGPLVVGEWGGAYRRTEDITWQNKFSTYLQEKSIGWFYWCINPNSGDTEGLLENDWNSPRTDKLTLLSAFKGTPVP